MAHYTSLFCFCFALLCFQCFALLSVAPRNKCNCKHRTSVASANIFREGGLRGRKHTGHRWWNNFSLGGNFLWHYWLWPCSRRGCLCLRVPVDRYVEAAAAASTKFTADSCSRGKVFSRAVTFVHAILGCRRGGHAAKATATQPRQPLPLCSRDLTENREIRIHHLYSTPP